VPRVAFQHEVEDGDGVEQDLHFRCFFDEFVFEDRPAFLVGRGRGVGLKNPEQVCERPLAERLADRLSLDRLQDLTSEPQPSRGRSALQLVENPFYLS
jgi:hypothetical protein